MGNAGTGILDEHRLRWPEQYSVARRQDANTAPAAQHDPDAGHNRHLNTSEAQASPPARCAPHTRIAHVRIAIMPIGNRSRWPLTRTARMWMPSCTVRMVIAIARNTGPPYTAHAPTSGAPKYM